MDWRNERIFWKAVSAMATIVEVILAHSSATYESAPPTVVMIFDPNDSLDAHTSALYPVTMMPITVPTMRTPMGITALYHLPSIFSFGSISLSEVRLSVSSS